MCLFKKGYFPESAHGIDEKFAFVSLDLDLYKPTLEGLRFFYPKMIKGGNPRLLNLLSHKERLKIINEHESN